ncbi:MAG: class I SAM-dependent methyltransferase [Ignavibacteriales bacterium]
MGDDQFAGSIPEIYDRFMGPMLFEPYAVDTARRFEGFEGALLETAAGTGRVTRHLAQAAPQSPITATDLSEAMLARAAAVVDAPNVTWRQADALVLPFEDDSFDAVVCQFGAMFFPDKAAGFAEARRVLKSGGRYVFSVWDELAANDVSEIAEAAVAALFPEDPPVFFAQGPFGYHDRERIRSDVLAAGFATVEIETVRLPTPAPSAHDAAFALVAGTPLRGRIEARDPARLDEAVDAAARALRAHFGEGAFTGTGQAVTITAGNA